MTSNSRWMVLAATFLLMLGCGKKNEGSKQDEGAGAPGEMAAGGKRAGGCDRRAKEKVCGEYLGAAKTDWVKKECEALGAPFVEACPKEGAVGRCVNHAGTAMEVHTLYYAPMTKETVTAMCQAPQQVREP
jgi:hypothetical protein